jgi:hypothetical protein
MNKNEQIHLSPDTGRMGGGFEIRREESPARFLSHLIEVSGMRPIAELESQRGETKNIPRLAQRVGVTGGIIVGSCTDATSTPKDVDVVICLNQGYSDHVYDFLEEMKTQFDQSFALRYEYNSAERSSFRVTRGRLDILGTINFFETPDPHIARLLYNTDNPIAISYDLDEARVIQSVLDTIGEMRQDRMIQS